MGDPDDLMDEAREVEADLKQARGYPIHPRVLRVVCQYCGEILRWGMVDDPKLGGTSHGICNVCLDERYPDPEKKEKPA